jgi:FkbM family methyltransferase
MCIAAVAILSMTQLVAVFIGVGYNPPWLTIDVSLEQQLPEHSELIIDSSSVKSNAILLPQSNEDEFQVSCLKNVLWNELPIASGKDKGTKRDVVFAHHGDAGHWKVWNKAIDSRFKNLKILDSYDESANHGNKCRVWEIGANVAADDSKAMMKMYKNCEYYAFEPVPYFNELLVAKWKDEGRMTIHKFGIGNTDASFNITNDVLQGKNGVSTFLGDASGGDIEIQIKSFDYALSHSNGIPTMIQMNCEGCEWTVIPEALKHGWLQKVSIIQIGWHSYGKVGIGARAWQLCEIREMLSRTHVMDYGLAFGWERWSIKENR